jgi:hypothetical protein
MAAVAGLLQNELICGPQYLDRPMERETELTKHCGTLLYRFGRPGAQSIGQN